MKKNIGYSLIFTLFCFKISAQTASYDIESIPKEIKEKASVIVRLEDIRINVESYEKVTQNVHKIFTVLNDEGKHALLFNEYSSKNISLEDVEIKVFDSNSKLKEKHKKKEMRITSVGEGLIDEGYVTFYSVAPGTYPVTIEVNYEKKFRSTLSLPDYNFIKPGEGVIESNFTIKAPAEIALRYKRFNTSIEPSVIDEGNYKTYKWGVKNLAPIEYEEGTGAVQNIYPHIAIAADNFSHYGFKGSLSTWKNFGLWIAELYKGLDILPPDRQQFFSELVKDAPSDTEKIKRIYQYLQNNFRYVSIQLGIGGLQPFSAEFTDKKKYGDCKALSNYMKAALKSVGIKSHVAIINAGYNQQPVPPDFPSNEFNHVIVCAPFKKDSIWLECTSSTSEFGELGAFTENRNALLITEEGGFLVSTPKSRSSANIFSATTIVNVSDDMSAETETVFNTKGFYKEMLNDILKEKSDEQSEDLFSSLGFKQPDEFKMDKGTDAYDAKLKMHLRSLQEFKAGSKSFMSQRMYKIWSSQLPKSENRKFDFYFPHPLEKYDTTIFKLPLGMKPDALPKEKELKCEYAFYHSKSWYNETENSIYSTCSLIIKQQLIPAATYAPVKKLFDELMQDDSQKIVIKAIN